MCDISSTPALIFVPHLAVIQNQSIANLQWQLFTAILVLQAFCELVSLVQTASSFHHCNP
jgi:hypothetical protein